MALARGSQCLGQATALTTSESKNDSKLLVSFDLTEINHKAMPPRPPAEHYSFTESLKTSVEALQTPLAKLEATTSCHRADFEREPERSDGLAVELLQVTLDAQTAKEAVTGLDNKQKDSAIAAMVASAGSLIARRARPAAPEALDYLVLPAPESPPMWKPAQ